ncbi:MAG: hypothetical protein A3F17_04590 [Gammaproteobacteria bacterium RIFCSPHIGHO2_12_FULL_41_15]|nr:MAG: hypothetical protein A3F17_04590 [Gammaproteobacteria bacterium RIFCSPHIGHO2_12_FULL_41_15]
MTINNPGHENILIQILKDIYTDKEISPFLGFKGGTAAYLFYKLDRFSIDLDFDLLDITKKDKIFLTVGEILKKQGSIKDSRIKRYSLFFLLSYGNNSRNIKVEINLRKFGSHYEIKSYLGISMLLMVREDMFAHKLVAMFERLGKTNRDIYDVHFFLKNRWPINEKIIEERTSLLFSIFLKKCVLELKKIGNQHILSGIGELLTPNQKTWVKAHLLEDTVFLLQAREK